MNRNLPSAFSVLISCCALVLGLVATVPASLPLAAAASASSSQATLAEPAIAAHVAAVAQQFDARTATATLQDTAATSAAAKPSRHSSGKSRRIRQSMAMPFFSFAPRG